jgi:PilZ domain
MEERRATPRRRVFKAGAIEFDGASVDCTIRNLSPAGASFDIASPVGIPHEITLNVVTHQTRQRGYVVWRKERRVGMAFA